MIGAEDALDLSKVYPTGLKFAATMTAVCLSFTLVGLVSQTCLAVALYGT